MDKNSLLGFVLIAGVLVAFSYISQPSKTEIAEKARQDSIAKVANQKAAQAAQAAQAKAKMATATKQETADTTSAFYSAQTAKDSSVVLKNNRIELTLNTKGGTVSKAIIKGFNSNPDGKSSITLFDSKDQHLKFMLAGKEENIITDELVFTPSAMTDSTVTMTAKSKNGGAVKISYRLHDDYLLDMNVSTSGLEGMFSPNYDRMDVVWTENARQQERGHSFENRYATLTYKEADGSTDYINETKAKTDEDIEPAIDWVAFKNQFFSAVLISKKQFDAHSLMTSIPQDKATKYLKNYGAKMKTFFDPSGRQPSEFVMFFGPNKFRLLQDMNEKCGIQKDLKMEHLVYLGWPLFRLINRWFTLYVFDWLTALNINMGIVLLLITLLLKVITYPMVKKSYMSSAKMRVLRPKINKLTEQYTAPEDNMKKQQETMALYSKYSVSPLSGCLPMLISMPIWIAMFNFVPNAIELRGESFLWIHDLSTYDPIIEWSKNIPMLGDHLSLTCVLFCIANVLYSVMNMRQTKDQMVGDQAQQMKMMQWMMYLMPVMFFFIFNDYSAGLNYYYFISLLLSAIIMWALRKTTNDEKLLAILEARYKENQANPKKRTGGLAARLEALQKQQQEMQQRNNADLQRRKNDFNKKK
jgi:YidC/Oxa1 family membrane protein insertase